MENSKQIKFFFVIAERKKKEELVSRALEVGARMISSIYANGSINATAFEEMFGFANEQKKIILMSLIPSEMVDKLMDILINDFDFNKPNTGIAFSMPAEGLSY